MLGCAFSQATNKPDGTDNMDIYGKEPRSDLETGVTKRNRKGYAFTQSSCCCRWGRRNDIRKPVRKIG